MPEPANWVVVVHGGCKPIKPSEAAANREGLQKALEEAAARLSAGGSAVDAVEAAIRSMEDDPTFNAGMGSVTNAEGVVEVDAGIMDGETLAIGGVCAVEDMTHPIQVARAMLASTETLLAGDGAVKFAREKALTHALGKVRPQQAASADTVGCVALDTEGRIAAGTSTGGLQGARAGRVGDSPLPGCGLYADNRSGAVSATGEGESISRAMLAARVAMAMENRVHPQQAVDQALKSLARVRGEAGLIALDPGGRFGWRHTGTQFAVGWIDSQDPRPRVELANMEEAREDG